MSTPTITRAQRDALYQALLDRIGALGDLQMLIDAEEDQAASSLARDLSDDLRFIVDDLKFGSRSDPVIEITTPPDVLGRVLRRLRDQAAAAEDADRPDLEATLLAQADNRTVRDTCQSLLKDLGP